ncbi:MULTISPECIES: hypothetical protein [unclassified Bradyrhizobium]|uniref:hypothetical protein n=1 Tax=unclassified Bradyrhizobium TaxID=2631580 RepID=UPI002916FC40|nr:MULTISPECIES: hypothetical protein [unclassified Bradyrhizobium]
MCAIAAGTYRLVDDRLGEPRALVGRSGGAGGLHARRQCRAHALHPRHTLLHAAELLLGCATNVDMALHIAVERLRRAIEPLHLLRDRLEGTAGRVLGLDDRLRFEDRAHQSPASFGERERS